MIGVVGFASRYAQDVRSALLLLSQRLGHHDRGGVVIFNETDKVATLGYRVLDPKVPAGAHIATGSIAIGFQLMKVLCGPYWRPLETNFAIRRPVDVKPYQNLFGDSIRFNAGEFSFSFAAEWLDSKVRRCPQYRRLPTILYIWRRR